MSEHEQQSEETPEEGEETMKDLDLPDEQGADVKGGFSSEPLEGTGRPEHSH